MSDVVLYRCGYCGTLFSREDPAEKCPAREGILPHASGNLYKQTAFDEKIFGTLFIKKCKSCDMLFETAIDRAKCPECNSTNVVNKDEDDKLQQVRMHRRSQDFA